MKRFFGAAALVAASLAIAFLLGEVAVRALWRDQTVMFPRYHTDYSYGSYRIRGIRPNAEFWHTSVDGSWKFTTNSRGLRDTREFSYEKAPGTLRVLVLGDSHTQGYEVRQEATFAAVLERYLARHGVRAEVLNAGVSGFSNAEQLVYLEQEGHRYQPDVVVLGFYANDFEDNLKAGLYLLEEERLVQAKREHLPGVRIQNAIYSVPGVPWLSENSYAYSLVFNGVWLYFKNALRERAKNDAAPADVPELEYAVATKRGHSEYEIALAEALVQRMRAFCESRGMRFIAVDIPRPGDRYEHSASVPPGMLQNVELVRSEALLADYGGAVETHVPNGHRHISEFTHALIGAELGRRIVKR